MSEFPHQDSNVLEAFDALYHAGKLDGPLEGIARYRIEQGRTLSDKQYDWARSEVDRACEESICPVHGVPMEVHELSLFLDTGHCCACEHAST